MRKTKAKVNAKGDQHMKLCNECKSALCNLDPREDTINLEDTTKKQNKQNCPC